MKENVILVNDTTGLYYTHLGIIQNLRIAHYTTLKYHKKAIEKSKIGVNVT